MAKKKTEKQKIEFKEVNKIGKIILATPSRYVYEYNSVLYEVKKPNNYIQGQSIVL